MSVIGAALHIVTHAVGKITLFFAAGAIYMAAHKTKVSELDGIARHMPWTMAAFVGGGLSIGFDLPSGPKAALASGSGAVAFEGTIRVKGKVIDDDGAPVPQVAVAVRSIVAASV